MLSWKYVLRNLGRSFFILFSISISIIAAIWIVAFFDGMNFQTEKAVVDTNTGHFQLQEKNYSDSQDSRAAIDFTAAMEKSLIHPEVLAYSPELVLDANISQPEGAAMLSVLGIVPALHSKLLPIKEHLTSGAFITEDSSGAVIGEELANVFGFSIGDELLINYQDVNGELRSEIIPIQGIYDFNSKLFEKKYVYINQKVWSQLFFNAIPTSVKFSRIVIEASSLKSLPAISEIGKTYDLNVRSWKNLNPEMSGILEFNDGMIRFFFLIIAVTITMTILNPVRILWQERVKELTMLTVIGVSKKILWTMGLIEALILVFISFLISGIVLTPIILYQKYAGLNLSFLKEGEGAVERAGIELPGIIYPILHGNQILVTIVFTVLSLLFCYAISIRNALKRAQRVS
jgi:ABC-type lipoprotein release transport system permease subunit